METQPEPSLRPAIQMDHPHINCMKDTLRPRRKFLTVIIWNQAQGLVVAMKERAWIGSGIGCLLNLRMLTGP